jgi:hypothetical protein
VAGIAWISGLLAGQDATGADVIIGTAGRARGHGGLVDAG